MAPIKRMDTVRRLAAQEDKPGMELSVFVTLATTGMALTVFSASMVKSGTQSQSLVFVTLTMSGMGTSVRNHQTVQEEESSTKIIKCASALMDMLGMETPAL